MSPARLETFADGVFAIAATLLILTVDGAVGGEGIDLGASLRTRGRRTSATSSAS